MEKKTKTKNLQTSSTPGTPVASQQGAADLLAFGPSRHRAWVVGQRPLECSFGSSGNEASRGPLGGSFEASWGPFWGLLGPLLGLFWASWGVMGASWVPLWGFLGASWGLLGASWGPLGASWGPLGAPCGPLAGLLGVSWGFLGASRGPGFEMSVRVPRPRTSSGVLDIATRSGKQA